MPVNAAILKSEIATDPKGLGYSGKDDGQIARLLTRAGLSGETVEVSVINAATAQSAVVAAEFVTLTPVQENLWRAILTLQQIPINNLNIRAQIAQVWLTGTVTRANLAALQRRSASRAEALFGEGAGVGHEDVAVALRGRP